MSAADGQLTPDEIRRVAAEFDMSLYTTMFPSFLIGDPAYPLTAQLRSEMIVVRPGMQPDIDEETLRTDSVREWFIRKRPAVMWILDRSSPDSERRPADDERPWIAGAYAMFIRYYAFFRTPVRRACDIVQERGSLDNATG